MTESNHGRKPLRFRFSIRGLLLFVTLFGVVAFYAKRRFVDQMIAHDHVIHLGGGLMCDHFPDVTTVHLGQSQVQDKDLLVLRHFPKLSEVRLNDTRISDEGLLSLAGLAPRLRLLDVRGTNTKKIAVESLQRKLVDCSIITDFSPDHLKAKVPRGYNCPECDCNFYGSGGKKPCPSCNHVCTAPLN